MTHASTPEDLALHGVRVLGFPTASRVAARYGLGATGSTATTGTPATSSGSSSTGICSPPSGCHAAATPNNTGRTRRLPPEKGRHTEGPASFPGSIPAP
jgi:hypothetical protein